MPDFKIKEFPAAGTPRFTTLAAHRLWLIEQRRPLLDFFQRPSFNPAGGFYSLDENARPLPQSPDTKARTGRCTRHRAWCTASPSRTCFGIPGADRIVDHGLAFLWERMRDAENGGYFWGVDDEKPTHPTKQAYGHAFVLLAASRPRCAWGILTRRVCLPT